MCLLIFRFLRLYFLSFKVFGQGILFIVDIFYEALFDLFNFVVKCEFFKVLLARFCFVGRLGLGIFIGVFEDVFFYCFCYDFEVQLIYIDLFVLVKFIFFLMVLCVFSLGRVRGFRLLNQRDWVV